MSPPLGQEETNIVNTVGVLPYKGAGPIAVGRIPDGAIQIAKGAEADNSIVVIHEVTALQTLYLSVITFSIRNESGGRGAGWVAIRNASSQEQYYPFNTCVPADGGVMSSVLYFPPLELAAGWEIALKSTVAGVSVTGSIHGYEI